MLIKTRRFLFIVSLCALLTVSVAVSLLNAAKANKWDVYPDYTRSMIQTIIDGASDGDTVLFHAGTYDWSDTELTHRWENAGAIYIIDKTLTLRGETGTLLIGPNSIDGTGDALALGANAFKIIDLDTNNNVTFDHLYFQNFLRAINCGYISFRDPAANVEICVPNLGNLTIKNCIFSDMHRDAISIAHIGGNVLIQNNEISAARYGLYCDWYWSENHLAWQPEATYIRILDNKIVALASGLIIQKTTNVIVTNNSISCPTGTGIAMASSNDGAYIAKNALSNCRYGMSIWGWTNGLVIEWNVLNKISGFGIGLWNADCHENVVSKNRIELTGTWGAGIESNANNNIYGQNTIMGTGWSAFWLTGDSMGSAHKETLQANNVDSFTPAYCHFYLGPTTHNNLIIGSGMEINTCIDLGMNNRITGAISLPGGIGQDLTDAIHLRNDELKGAKPAIY